MGRLALIVVGLAVAIPPRAAFALGGALVSTVLLVALGADGHRRRPARLQRRTRRTRAMPRGPRRGARGRRTRRADPVARDAPGIPVLAPFALASWVTVIVARRFTFGEPDVVIRTPS